MARHYSVDFRERVLASFRAGVPADEIATLLGVSVRSIYRWNELERETGGVAPRPKSGRPPLIGPDAAGPLQQMVEAHPAATIDEYCQMWEACTGTRVSRSTMCSAINRLGYVRKKGVSSPANSRRRSAPVGEKTMLI